LVVGKVVRGYAGRVHFRVAERQAVVKIWLGLGRPNATVVDNGGAIGSRGDLIRVAIWIGAGCIVGRARRSSAGRDGAA
jgi:hypothetical protein